MVVAESNDRILHMAPEEPDIMSQNEEMQESLSSSTLEEIFSCNQCMESFEDRETLFKHVKSAHQQHVHCRRRFKCDQCQKKFKSMSGLRNHARTHSVFFGSAAGVPGRLTSGAVHPGHSNSPDTTTNIPNGTDAPCTLDSTFTVEKDFDSMDVYNLEKTVTEPNEKTGSDTKERVSGSRDKCDNARDGMRRRSGIPLPVRRSLLICDQSGASQCEPKGSLNIELEKVADKSNREAQKFDTTSETSHTSLINSRESRRLTRVINTGHVQAAKQNLQRASIFKSRMTSSRSRTPVKAPKSMAETKLTLKSPFGSKYTTKVNSPITPRKRNRSKPGTPKNVIKTPKGGKSTPCKGKSTPLNGKSTPGSAKKGTPVCTGYHCKKCGKSFVDRSKLDVHFAVHARETPEKCGIPKHALKKTPNFQERLLVEASDVNKSSFSCKQCGRMYEKKTYLEAHMKTHDVNTPFSCPQCDKKFRFLSSLKAHSFVHQGESRDQGSTSNNIHKAPTRERDFRENLMKFNIFSVLSSEENLMEDYSIQDDLPFSCKMCDFQTRGPAEFLIHMKSHSKSGPYTCTHCSKSYKLQKNLRVHEKVHTINRIKKLLIENTINKTMDQSTVAKL